MTEYVCDLPIEGIASFGMGSFDVPVREEIVRCRDCKWATPSEEPEGQDLLRLLVRPLGLVRRFEIRRAVGRRR